jgi:SAM-dependent methyltransferase
MRASLQWLRRGLSKLQGNVAMLKENEIRPGNLFEEYLRLSAEDAQKIFDFSTAAPRKCPGCGQDDAEMSFIKNGFTFVHCRCCGSLYANPLPPAGQFETFYRVGESSRYWSEVFLPAVEEARKGALMRPKVTRVWDYCSAAGVEPKTVLDVGASHGAFLKEFVAAYPNVKPMAVEPNPQQAERCRTAGIETMESTGEAVPASWHGVADLVTSFEVLEHVPDPLLFIRQLATLVRPGGIAIVTTLGVDGFDIQLLWEQSNSVSPPHHLNFCSRKGFAAMFRQAGFSDIKITTPGKLDVDIVMNALSKGAQPALSRFEQLLLESGEAVRNAFQGFLAENGLSSHTWIVAQKAPLGV